MDYMRTTVDLPEQLLRRVKAAAALKGVPLRAYMATLLERGLSEPEAPARKGQHRPVPVVLPKTGHPIPAMTNAELDELFLRDELGRMGPDRSA